MLIFSLHSVIFGVNFQLDTVSRKKPICKWRAVCCTVLVRERVQNRTCMCTINPVLQHLHLCLGLYLRTSLTGALQPGPYRLTVRFRRTPAVSGWRGGRSSGYPTG